LNAERSERSISGGLSPHASFHTASTHSRRRGCSIPVVEIDRSRPRRSSRDNEALQTAAPRRSERRNGAPIRWGLLVGGGWRGGRPRREGGDRSTQGRVGGEDAEIAMAVKARRGHQRGEAGEQLEWGQAMRGTAAGAWFRGVVDEALGIEFAQPIQSEGDRRAGGQGPPVGPGWTCRVRRSESGTGVYLALLPLLSRQVVVDEVRVDGLRANLSARAPVLLPPAPELVGWRTFTRAFCRAPPTGSRAKLYLAPPKP